MTHIILVRQDDGVLMGYEKADENEARTFLDKLSKMHIWGKHPTFQLFKAELIAENKITHP